MPILLSQPVVLSVPVTTQQEVTCNHLWLLSLRTDATALVAGPVGAEINLLPYFDGPPPVFAPQEAARQRTTKDLYAAAATLAANGRVKMAQAMQLVFEGVQEWDDEMREREAILAGAQSAADSANAAAATAQNARDTARLNLFSLEQDSYPDDEARAAKVGPAQTELETLESALVVAQQQQALANVSLQEATAAAQDAANPRYAPAG